MYGGRWVRERSAVGNRELYQKLSCNVGFYVVCEEKLKAASVVDEKIFAKYNKNLLYISILDQADEQISLVLPKISKSTPAEHFPHIAKLRQIVDKIKGNAESIDSLTVSIGEFLDKTNYALIAGGGGGGREKSKEQIFRETFAPLEGKINEFNVLSKVLKEQVEQAAGIAMYLNNESSKNVCRSKVEHQGVLGTFGEIRTLFGNFEQSLVFYEKLRACVGRLGEEVEEFVGGREVEGRELEDKIRGRGEPGGAVSKIVVFPSIRGEGGVGGGGDRLFGGDGREELETPQEITYVLGGGSGLEPAKMEYGGGGTGTGTGVGMGLGYGLTGTQEGDTPADIATMLSNFCNILTPETDNKMGQKKQ